MLTRPIRHLPVAPLGPPGGSFDPSGLSDELAGSVSLVTMGPQAAPNPGSPLGSPLPDGEAATEDGEKLLQVGDIAKVVGKTVRAIHHYEEVGLLRPHARSKGRYRLYDQGAINRVRWIGKLHDLGLSLAQIQELLRIWEAAPSAPGAMARIRGIYAKKLEETRAQIAHLATLERELEASIGYLDTCETCDPAEIVRACTSCHHHAKTECEPELVAGIHGGNGHRTNPPKHSGSTPVIDGAFAPNPAPESAGR